MAKRAIEIGDIAGIGLPIIDKHTGELKGHKIVARGLVVAIYQPGIGKQYRAKLWWDTPNDRTVAFIHTGHEDFVFTRRLILIEKGTLRAARRYH